MDVFKTEFLKSYLAAGLGAMSKRDIDALVISLLDEYGFDDMIPLKNLTNHQMSIKLRTPVSRIKSLRYEAALKYTGAGEISVKENLLKIIAKSSFDVERGKVSFVIEDAFTQQWLQGLLKANNLVVDTSFNSEIVKVDSDGLCDVLAMLFNVDTANEFRANIERLKTKQGKLTFAEAKMEFLKGAANGLGNTATNFSISALLALVPG